VALRAAPAAVLDDLQPAHPGLLCPSGIAWSPLTSGPRRWVPRSRQRVVEPFVPTGPPVWRTDAHFALSYHLRRMHQGPDGSMDGLMALVQTLAMAPFDRTRPLWEGTLIEGLEGGRAAYLLKLHHSLTDGLGAIQLMSLVQSRTREHTAGQADPVLSRTQTGAPGGDDALSVTVEGARHTLGQMPSILAAAADAGNLVGAQPWRRGVRGAAVCRVPAARPLTAPGAVLATAAAPRRPGVGHADLGVPVGRPARSSQAGRWIGQRRLPCGVAGRVAALPRASWCRYRRDPDDGAGVDAAQRRPDGRQQVRRRDARSADRHRRPGRTSGGAARGDPRATGRASPRLFLDPQPRSSTDCPLQWGQRSWVWAP
jgi:hypothetical protein